MSLIEIYHLRLVIFIPKFEWQQPLTFWKVHMRHFLILLLAFSPLNFVYAEEDYHSEQEYYDESSDYEDEEPTYEEDEGDEE